MKYFISGAFGYVGCSLVENLLSDKNTEKVTVLDNLRYRQSGFLNLLSDPRLDFIHGDVRDEKLLCDCVSRADVIFPLAAIVGAPACDREKVLASQVNYGHVRTIVSAMTVGQKVIYPNTNSGYGVGSDTDFCTEETPLKPISHYGVTKCEAEQFVLDHGGVSVRLATVFGLSPRMRLDLLVNDFTYKAMRDRYIVLFEQNFRRNYIHVKDVALAFRLLEEKYPEGNSFNVGLSSANLTKRQLAEKIKEYVPGFVIHSDEFAKDVDKRDYVVSNAKLEALGWTPQYTLDDGIKELIKAYPVLSAQEKSLYTNL